MDTIYKYPLQLVDHQTVMLPAGAEILSAQMVPPHLVGQFLEEDVWFWAKVEPAREVVPYTFYILGTGHPYDPKKKDYTFLETIRMDMANTAMFFHIFYKKEN